MHWQAVGTGSGAVCYGMWASQAMSQYCAKCLSQYVLKCHFGGWYCGIVNKTISCNAGFPHELWFVSWLLNLLSGSLLITWEKSRRLPKCVGPYHVCGRQAEDFGFGLAHAWPSQAVDGRSSLFLFALFVELWFSIFLMSYIFGTHIVKSHCLPHWPSVWKLFQLLLFCLFVFKEFFIFYFSRSLDNKIKRGASGTWIGAYKGCWSYMQ